MVAFCVERSGQNADRVVAAIAVAREFDALGAHENVDAGAIERRAEGIGMQRLAPLVVGLLVAVPAVSRIGKGAGRQESPCLRPLRCRATKNCLRQRENCRSARILSA